MTTRRVSSDIEYSQPVIYEHLASIDDLVEAVALAGFGELARALGEARRDAAPDEAVGAVAHAYSGWASGNPVVFDAMFTRTTGLRPGQHRGPLSTAHTGLRTAAAAIAGDRDVDILTDEKVLAVPVPVGPVVVEVPP